MTTRGIWPNGADPWQHWSRKAPPPSMSAVPMLAVESKDGKSAIKMDGLIKASDLPSGDSYVGAGGFTPDFANAADFKGNEGAPGKKGDSVKGDAGANGWTPLTTGEQDGVRSLIFVDWIGGAGAKPDAGYIGPKGSTGLVAKANAFNFNPSRSIKLTGKTNAAGEIAFTLPEPMADPFISPVLYPSSSNVRNVRLSAIGKNTAGKVVGFTVKAEAMATAKITLIDVLTLTVNPIADAAVVVLVVDVS